MNQAVFSLISAGIAALIACGGGALEGGSEVPVTEPYTVNTRIEEVTGDPAFGDYGRLIFPVDSGYFSGDTLGGLSLTWYNYIAQQQAIVAVGDDDGGVAPELCLLLVKEDLRGLEYPIGKRLHFFLHAAGHADMHEHTPWVGNGFHAGDVGLFQILPEFFRYFYDLFFHFGCSFV